MPSYRLSFTSIATFFLALAATRAVEEHWALLGNKVYLITDRRLNWFMGADYCTTKGMHMLSIDSTEEHIRFVKYLQSRNINTNVWTAGNDLATGMEWVWLSTGKLITYTHWGEGQPRDGDGNCIEIRRCISYYWRVQSCMTPNLVVCEVRVSSAKDQDLIVHRQTFTEE